MQYRTDKISIDDKINPAFSSNLKIAGALPRRFNRAILPVILASLCVLSISRSAPRLDDPVTIARMKYGGGGDWYSNPSSIPNLLKFLRVETGIGCAEDEQVIEITSPRLSQYPILYMNGHGNVLFTDREVTILRHYLESGGFLIADDNYGMDASFRREIRRVLNGGDLVELPFSHPIYSSHFIIHNGLPKIHEHDGKPAQGFGIFLNGKMVGYYSYQADLGDGWEDPDVHEDPPEKRLAALRMGANIVIWRLRGGQ